MLDVVVGESSGIEHSKEQKTKLNMNLPTSSLPTLVTLPFWSTSTCGPFHATSKYAFIPIMVVVENLDLVEEEGLGSDVLVEERKLERGGVNLRAARGNFILAVT